MLLRLLLWLVEPAQEGGHGGERPLRLAERLRCPRLLRRQPHQRPARVGGYRPQARDFLGLFWRVDGGIYECTSVIRIGQRRI